MSLLDRLLGRPERTVDDPRFGRLVREDGQWHGQMSWLHGQRPFALTVERAPGPPNATDHLAFDALRDGYPALAPTLAAALFAHWEAVAGDLEPAPPAIASANALWAALELQGLCVAANGTH